MGLSEWSSTELDKKSRMRGDLGRATKVAPKPFPDASCAAHRRFSPDFPQILQGLLNVPFWVYWTSPYSSHLVDHIPIMESNGWVMFNGDMTNDSDP